MTNFFNNLKKIKEYNVFFDGTILAIVRCITLLSTIIQTMLIARFLTIEEYGVYSQLLMIISITSSFTALGLNNAVNYFYNIQKSKQDKDKYVSNIFNITIISGLIGIIVSLILRTQIANYFSNKLLTILILYILFIPVTDNIIGLYTPIYISLKKSKTISIRNLIISIIKTILIPLSYYLTKDIKYIFLTQLTINIIQIAYFAIDINKCFKYQIHSNIKVIKEILKYAIPLAIATMIGTLFKESDKLVIAKLMTIKELAIYTNMSKQLPFEFISLSFVSVITPIIVKKLKDNKVFATNLWKSFLEFSYIISWTLTCCAILCSKELLIFLYTEKYLEGYMIFNIYLITELFRFTYFGLILSSCGKTKFITISSIISLIVNIILNVLLYRIIGFTGPAWATLFSTAIMGLIQIIYSCKILEIKLSDLFDYKKSTKCIFQLIFTGMIIYLIKNNILKLFNNNIIELIITALLYVTINLILFRKRLILLIKEMKYE